MKVSDVKAEEHKRQLKLTLFDAKKSAALAVWLVAVPCFFLLAVFMKYFFRLDLHIFTIVEEFAASIDRTFHFPASVILLVGFPLAAVAINMLSILHVAIDRDRRELLTTIKLKWINIAFVLLGVGIVGIFLVYAIVENVRPSL